MQWVVVPVLGLLVATALMIARVRDLWACIMATGIYSFLGAGWMLLLDAPDVAFTEAAVGAGIATVLMLTTLSLTGCKTREVHHGRRVMAMLVVFVTGAALVYGTLDMPSYGDPSAPIHVYPDPSFVDRTQHDMHGLPNVVTAVLASYRGYDTFGETTVIFTAGVAVLLVIGSRRKIVHAAGPAGSETDPTGQTPPGDAAESAPTEAAG